MQYEAEKQLVEMLKNANKGINAVPDLAKSLIKQYQYQQIFLSIIGVALVIIGTVMFIYWAKNVNSDIFSTKSEQAFSGYVTREKSGFTWCWLTITILSLFSGLIMFTNCVSNAIAPGLSLIEKLLSK